MESDPAAAAARPNQLQYLWDFWLADFVAAVAAVIFFRLEKKPAPQVKMSIQENLQGDTSTLLSWLTLYIQFSSAKPTATITRPPTPNKAIFFSFLFL